MSARVVVAEDDIKQAELARRYLQRDGYEVTVVHDGPASIRPCGAPTPMCSCSR